MNSTSTADEILTELRSRGVKVKLGTIGKLRLAPARAIEPALLDRVRQQKAALITKLRAECEKAEINRLARADGWRPLPPAGHTAYSLLGTCQRFGVMLRIDPGTGDLVVGKAGAKAEEPTQPWRSLLTALETHLEDVAVLVEAGWTLKAGFPKRATA